MGNASSQRVRPLILNVNDSEGTRYMVTLMLRRAGFDVIEAESGEAALESIAQH